MNFYIFQRTSKYFQRKSLAFTLIEMLVTLSIVTLLTVMVIGYSRRGESLTNLMRESERLIYNLKLAQSSAMLTLKNSNQIICGWGVAFDVNNNQYFLFKDLAQTSCQDANYEYDGGSELVDNLKPLNGVIIKSVNVDSIVFIPPNPDVNFTTNDGDSNAKIQLCLANDTNQCVNIRVTKTGLIYKE